MLQHFGNFRVILRVDLAGRSRAKILQLQRQSQFLVHVFSQNRKLHRADFQYLLMKTFQIKGGIAVLLSDPENSDIPHSISDN